MSTKKVLTVQDVKEMGGRISSSHESRLQSGGNIGDIIGGNISTGILSEIVLNDGCHYIPTTIENVSITIITGTNSSTVSAQNIWINKDIANKFYDIVESGEGFDSFFVSTSSTLSVNNVVPKGSLFFHKASGRWISNSRTGMQIKELISYMNDNDVNYDQTLRKDLLDSTIINVDAPYKMTPLFTNIEVIGDGLNKSCNQMLCEGEVGRVLTDEKVYIQVLSTYSFPSTVKSKRIASINGFSYRVNGGDINRITKSEGNIFLGTIGAMTSHANNLLGTFKEEDIIEAYPIPASGLIGSVISSVVVETFTGTNYTGTKSTVTLGVNQDLSRNTCIVAPPPPGVNILIPQNIITIHANTVGNIPPTGNEGGVTKYNLSANIGIRGAYIEGYFSSLKFIIADLSSTNSTPTTIIADCVGDMLTNAGTVTETIGSFPNGHNLSLSVEATIMVRFTATGYGEVEEYNYYTLFDEIRKTSTNVVLNGADKTIDIDFVLSNTSTEVNPNI